MSYNQLATQERIHRAAAALSEHGFSVSTLASAGAALDAIKEMIPAGASVMNGSSRTLDQIGFTEYLKEVNHGWNNLHDAILKETDPKKQGELRAHAVVSEYYLGSAHAISETGEIVVASNTGSQLPHLAFTSPNIILVVSTAKITGTLADALKRVEEHVVPLEDQRAKEMGWGGTMHAKTLILHRENAHMGRKVHIIFVEEELGF